MNRIDYLDKYRFFTVTFALISHAILALNLEEVIGQEGISSISFITRSATPSLIILFGIMAEFIYYNRYKSKGNAIFSKLIYRSFLCYLVFVLLSIVTFLVGKKSISGLMGSALLLKSTSYSNIFVMYFFWLLLCIPILKLRHKLGFWGLLGLVGAIWTIDYFIIAKTVELSSPFNFIGGVLLGIGRDWGPSIFHGITLIVCGMLFADFLLNKVSTPSTKTIIAIIMIGSIVATSITIFNIGFVEYVENIVDPRAYRFKNNILYYLYGLNITCLIIIFSYLSNLLIKGKLSNNINFLGSSTFSYFVIGNMILIIFPTIQIASVWEALMFVFVFLIATSFLTFVWEKKLQHLNMVQSINMMTKNSSQTVWNTVNKIKRRKLS
ncbi:hypothetical protein IFO69_03970 [Echinicola sp. CAU 1574]|uniref:Acyltransferase 3 domain-containing protein n=1 Tax=Echinicola arenosa TaxID=2774144 RepID=A0ABR9AGS3_9BACT|nr:hypothetical protein [Echinicola arenosa]MBD8487900.1 hypothetical protein [Echinicola arenosa]